MTLLTICPVCGGGAIDRHCLSPTCPWEKCKTRQCSAVLNPTAGRGFVIEGETSRTVKFGGAS